MARVSVLIPAYKPGHLGQAVASVLSQTYTDYEILISDDSPEGSAAEVLDRFLDPRIRRFEGPRQGLTANSRFLWEQASGEYVKYVHDDDFLLPWALTRMVGVMDMEPRASFAFVERHEVRGEGAVRTSPRSLSVEKPTRFEADAVVNVLIGKVWNFIGEPIATLFRRAMFDDSAFMSSYAGMEIRFLFDVAMYLNALDKGPCIGVPEFHAAFRLHQAQTSFKHQPAFSYGVFEWELLLRAEFGRGRVTPESALSGIVELDRLYKEFSGRFPELEAFRQGLPKLREQVLAGERRLLEADFRTLLAEAEGAAAERVRTGWVSPDLKPGARRNAS